MSRSELRELRTQPRQGMGNRLAVDPANTNIVYAGSDRVSKSTDGGHSWKTVFPPPTQTGVNACALAIAPTRPEATYATRPTTKRTDSSIYKSTDAGKTWHATTSAPLGDQRQRTSSNRTRGRSPTSDHHLRGPRWQRPENDQRRQDLAADQRRTPDRGRPPPTGLSLPRERHDARGRPTPHRHRHATLTRAASTRPPTADKPGPSPTSPGGVVALHRHGRSQPRTPGDDLRCRRKPDGRSARILKKHQQRPQRLGHRTVGNHLLEPVGRRHTARMRQCSGMFLDGRGPSMPADP